MKGGARPGAGRPAGSKTVPQFRDYVSEDERKKFVEFVLDQYMSDIRLATWLVDQLFGKAPQPVVGEDGGLSFLTFAEDAALDGRR